MRADRFALGFLAFGLCAAALSCGDPFKMGSGSGTSMAGTGAGDPTTSSGGPISCMTEKDCPGADVGCVVRSCEQGLCSKKILMMSTSQLYGDCKITRCSEEGNPYVDNDDSDFYDDANFCTDDKCDQGSAVAVARTGMPCGTGNVTVCDANKQCVDCSDTKPCATGKTCTRGKCVLDSCSNGKLDPNETSPDCGGLDCNPCEDSKACNGELDCVSNNCTKDKDNKKICGSTCIDSKMDGEETGTDCGGPVCVQVGQACADGYGCKLPRDCMSGVCKGGKCQQPTCTDGVKNGAETAIDCGGTCGSCG